MVYLSYSKSKSDTERDKNMKLVNTNLVLFLMNQIQATKMQLELNKNIFDSLPDTTKESFSDEVANKILKYKRELLTERKIYLDKLISFERELREVLP